LSQRALRARWGFAARPALLALLLTCSGAHASSFAGFCDAARQADPAALDHELRFALRVQHALEASDADAALVARAGLDLGLIGQRYSHAALARRDAPLGPWAVRQLYFACDAGRSRLFDQGLAGFVAGAGGQETLYLSVVLLPGAPGRALADAARDDARALSVLSPAYSANAYAFSTQFENCNQWLAELMAVAWGGAQDRVAAQSWLRAERYAPIAVHAGLLMFAGWFSPWIHDGDHPPGDLASGIYRVSLPPSLEAFALAHVPGARRLEFCDGPGCATFVSSPP